MRLALFFLQFLPIFTSCCADLIKRCVLTQQVCQVALDSYDAVINGVVMNATFYSYTLPTPGALQNQVASLFQAGFSSVLVSYAAADNNLKSWAGDNLSNLLTALVNAGQMSHAGNGALQPKCLEVCGTYHLGNGVCDQAVFAANPSEAGYCSGPTCAFEVNDCWDPTTFNASNYAAYAQPDAPSASMLNFLQNEITTYWSR